MNTLGKQQGLGLVELMISITLGLFLISGALGVFISSKTSYNINNELTWIQDNSRFVDTMLKRDIRMAGFYGCRSNTKMVSTLNDAPSSGWFIDFEKKISGWDGDASEDYPTPEFPKAFNSIPAPNFPSSDILTLRRGSGQNIKIKDNDPPNSATIDIDGNHTFEDGDILILTDCEDSAVFQVTGNSKNKIVHNTGKGSPGNCTKLLGPINCSNSRTNKKVFRGEDGAHLIKVQSHAYFINTAADGTPTLYRRELRTENSNPDLQDQEIAPGVENMQVIYGLDANEDSSPDRFVNAEDIDADDWSKVVSVRLHLLYRSSQQVATEPQEFRFMGTSYNSKDKYIRQEIISSIDLRNRG